MRPLKDIKRLVGRAEIESTPEGNRAMLNSLLKELAARRGSVVQIPIARVAAIAALILIVALAVVGYLSREPVRQPPHLGTLSAADMLTVGRLNAACRRGGLSEVERQCEQATQRLQGRPERISTEQLIMELKGT